MGDFYIDLKDEKAPDVKELLFTTKAVGLKQMVEEDTRVSIWDGVAKKSKLDLIFTNSDSYLLLSAARVCSINTYVKRGTFVVPILFLSILVLIVHWSDPVMGILFL